MDGSYAEYAGRRTRTKPAFVCLSTWVRDPMRTMHHSYGIANRPHHSVGAMGQIPWPNYHYPVSARIWEHRRNRSLITSIPNAPLCNIAGQTLIGHPGKLFDSPIRFMLRQCHPKRVRPIRRSNVRNVLAKHIVRPRRTLIHLIMNHLDGTHRVTGSIKMNSSGPRSSRSNAGCHRIKRKKTGSSG